jgi:hypothetical protein
MGIFHGLTAGVIWAGGIALGLIVYYITFRRNRSPVSVLKPAGAIVFGVFCGWISSGIIVFVVAAVYSLKSLYGMGWINEMGERFDSDFMRDLFVATRFGWAHFITGTGLAVGMAMMTNAIWASGEWEQFLGRESRLDSLRHAWRMLISIMKIALRHVWPLPTAILLSAVIAYAVVQKPSAGAPKDDAVLNSASVTEVESAIRIHNKSRLGIATGLIGDCSTQAIGAFFGIVGMGFGMVILRCGLHIEPRKN